MRKITAIRILSSLLILLFTYAGLSKLTEHALFSAQLKNFPALGDYANLLSVCVPTAELVTACLLFFPSTQLYGLSASLGLLLLFTGFLIFMLAFDKDLPCSCGGIISALSWKQHVAFNLFFIVISLTGIVLCRRSRQYTGSEATNGFT